MKTVKINLYSFDELNKEAKQKAIEHYRDINVDFDWWSYDGAKEVGKILGIQIDNIWFSGFSSQGDGACFDGS